VAETKFKRLYAVGFDALVMRWDKCINVGGRLVEKHVFPRFELHVLYVLYPFVTYLLTLPRTSKITIQENGVEYYFFTEFHIK
jgi:hypothetical protein